jgi:hypothetical protein
LVNSIIEQQLSKAEKIAVSKHRAKIGVEKTGKKECMKRYRSNPDVKQIATKNNKVRT